MCLPTADIDVWQKPTQHCKAIILQLKIKILGEKRMLAIEGGVVGLRSELLEKNRIWCRQRMVQDGVPGLMG